jgi:NAD(P)-dependent dehydrogenase (short-subunit alcohol dehydrogenase family)
VRTWLITGATRGLGLETARAALAIGDQVVATGRNSEKTARALGRAQDRLLTASLDVTDPASIDAAVAAGMSRFGSIDVLVNNAGYGQLGHFEEHSIEAIDRQFSTNVFGAFAVTRAVLPAMRARRSGHIITISSICGLVGFDGASIYCATKFAITGWSESLSLELAPFGVDATVVHPGAFRTDFLDRASVRLADRRIDDYAEATASADAARASRNHSQGGDPVGFGRAIVELAHSEQPPTEFPAGSDALRVLAGRRERDKGTILDWGALAASTDHLA